MRQFLAGVGISLILGALAVAREKPAAPLAGWPGVFPNLQGYARTFKAPTVGKDETKGYSQLVQYEWTGGDIRSLDVTLSRSPDFRQDPRQKGKEIAPEERVEVGKVIGWFKDGVLTLPLGEDRRLTLKGGGSLDKDRVAGLAGKFDLAACNRALDAPPRTRFERSLDAFRAVKKGMTYADLTAWVGDADRDIGSGIHIMVYGLPDGSRVLVGTPDFERVMYIKYEGKDGKREDLLK